MTDDADEGPGTDEDERRLGAALRLQEEKVMPAWRRATERESRWGVSLAVLAAIIMQVALPHDLGVRPWWLLPALEAVLGIGLLITDPARRDRFSGQLRWASVALIILVTIANGWQAAHLVHSILLGDASRKPAGLLATGAAVWLTNVIVFSLWYWEMDRGGPGARARAERQYPDLMFPQMQNQHLAPPDWESTYIDYFYTAFTNATAFSPTDVMPMARWAKLAMLVQAAISLITAALVVAWAVGILK